MPEEELDYFEEAKKFIKKAIVPVDENTYEIRCLDYNQLSYLSLYRVYRVVNELSVKAKQEFVESGKTLTEDDLFLVRTMDELPENLTYQSCTKRGLYNTMLNPFELYLHYNVPKEEQEKYKIVCPIYRDTIHFALNGIASNIWYSSVFTNRGVVAVEPFKSHKAKMKNVNPVDTFIDVREEDEPISNQAIFIMDKALYQNLTQQMKEKIQGHKLYLFDSNGYVLSEKDVIPPLEMIADIVLWNEGYLPIHSKSQNFLRVESVRVEGETYTDKEYLKMFTDLIDKLSMEMFGISYYHLNDEIKNHRKIDKDSPGVSHWDTPYFNQEAMMNNQLRKDTVRRYLSYLCEAIGFPHEICQQMIPLYYNYIDANFSSESYGSRGHTYTTLMTRDARSFIQNVPLQNLIEATITFNQMELSRIRGAANKSELNQMLNEQSFSSDEVDLQKK